MRTRTDFPHSVVETPDLGIVLTDGCRLSARAWMPADASTHPVPAVLEYIPYRKRDGTLPRDEMMHPYMAGHGYACVRVDLRGSGDSAGLLTDEYTAQELADACEVIAWLAAQPWCSGTVGMMGKSWGGFNCLQTAALRPPALKAIITVCSTTDRFADDIHFKGGCLLGRNFGWGAVMLSYSSRPADPVLRQGWRADWLARLEADTFLAPRWAGHQARDGYWRHGSVGEDWAAIQVPVLAIGGWADNYMNTVGHLLENLKVPVKGIVGPWVHQYPHTAVPGPAIGFLHEALRWWDRWLKGVENGADADPAMRAFMLHSQPPDACAPHRAGHWLAEATWPSSRISRQTLALSPGGTLGGAGGALAVAVNTPQHLGLNAGEFFPMGLAAEMPGDQAADDALSVCFETAPLAAGMDLLGAARLALRLTSDQPFAFIVARLCDVAPDGASVRICHGMLNLRHRNSMAQPGPVPVGEAFDAELALDLTAYRLAPGHRLRLALSTTYWPFVWPSPRAATLTLLQGALELPLHAGSAGDEWLPPTPEAAAGWKHRTLRQGSAVRRIEQDLLTGCVALVVENDAGEVENLSHGLITGETLRERWSVHPTDPARAEATCDWTQTLRRGAWKVCTLASTRIWVEGDDLVMQARLEAWEGEVQVFARDTTERVVRDHV